MNKEQLLNEAAEKYAREEYITFGEDRRHLVFAFIAGAKWQAKQQSAGVQLTDEEIEASAEKEYPHTSWNNKYGREGFVKGFISSCLPSRFLNEEELFILAKEKGCGGGLEDVFIKGFKAALQYNAGGWIDACVRPEQSGEVLVFTESHSVYVSHYKKDRNLFTVYGVGNLITDIKVTHWQPLPSPPINK